MFSEHMSHKQIKKLRGQLQITQAEMAKRLGISVESYRLIEWGKRKPSKPVALLLEIEQRATAAASDRDILRP